MGILFGIPVLFALMFDGFSLDVIRGIVVTIIIAGFLISASKGGGACECVADLILDGDNLRVTFKDLDSGDKQGKRDVICEIELHKVLGLEYSKEAGAIQIQGEVKIITVFKGSNKGYAKTRPSVIFKIDRETLNEIKPSLEQFSGKVINYID